MITSTLLIFSLLAAPDLYFKRENGEVAVASGRSKGDWQRQILVKTFLSNGAEREAQGATLGFFPSISLRYSVAADSVWALDIAHNTHSGTRSFEAGATITSFALDELMHKGCLSDRPKDVALKKVIASTQRIDSAFNNMLSRQKSRVLIKLGKGTACPFWEFGHYSEIVHQLNNMDENPYATITVVEPLRAIVSIYVNKTVAFIELRRRKLSSAEIAESHKQSFSSYFDLDADALEWKSLGSSETGLETWASGIWSDDSVNLIGDDGYCERFKLVDGTFKRTGQVSGLPAPSAICHVGPDIWLLSEEKDAIEATKVSWDGIARHREIDLGRTSIDQAAQIVFDPEKLAWRLNYSLFVSVLPFLIAGVVVIFVAWRVMKARRLSRSG